MARLIPESPAGKIPNAVQGVFRFFKSLPEGWTIWHHLAPWEPESPDFMLLNPGGQVLLVKVSSAARADADTANQLLLGGVLHGFGQKETQTLVDFCVRVPGLALGKIVVFPNIPEKYLNSAEAGRVQGINWWGQEAFQTLDRWLAGVDAPPLDDLAVEKLRLFFCPESAVPAALTVRASEERRLQAGLTEYLLDFNQEAVLKADLDLNLPGFQAAKDLQISVVNGVAGSGKTLILLYRLRLLVAAFPNKRFLVLTHNRPLIADLKDRYRRLAGVLPENIEWLHFFRWCKQIWPKNNHPWHDPISVAQRESLAGEVIHLTGTKTFTAELLLGEIDWFKDQTLTSLEEYMVADRRGRGFRLSSDQRRTMAACIELYQSKLAAKGWVEWSDIPRWLWKWHQEKQINLPQYDVILIDEAQIFAPIWFEILLGAVAPHGHIFIVADPTQGFLGRGASWKSVGLDVRGRTHNLQRSYRTTREIFSFASRFFHQRQPVNDPDEEILSADLAEMPTGVVPTLLQVEHAQDEITLIANEIENMIKQGIPPGMILALHVTWQGMNQLITALDRRLGKNSARDAKTQAPGNFIRVTTLNAGGGLEAPFVFLGGLRSLLEREQSLRLSEEEKEKIIRENTRKVYMAVTRAGQRVYLTYAGKPPADLAGLLSN